MTDSEVNRKDGDELKEVVMAAANDNRGGKSDREFSEGAPCARPGCDLRSGSVALAAVLR